MYTLIIYVLNNENTIYIYLPLCVLLSNYLFPFDFHTLTHTHCLKQIKSTYK